MNYIARVKEELEELKETDRKFKDNIKGLTTGEAYKFYKKHKGTYQYNTNETKSEFARMNHKRCSFCTKYIAEFNMEMTIEHIETKRDCPKKIFQWDNLLCACRICNTKRSTNKYVADAYLDPTKVSDIEKYFSFHADGSISPNKDLSDTEVKKAQYMIGLYKLDRDDLNAERRKFFNNLLDDEFFQILKKKDEEAQDIHYLSVFTYYKRRIEDGK